MNYKYDIGELVEISKIFIAKGKIIDRLNKPEANLYQVEVLDHEKYKGKKLWFAEHEISRGQLLGL